MSLAFVSNEFDPRGDACTDDERQQLREWIRANCYVVGQAEPSAEHTAEDFARMGMVGIYKQYDGMGQHANSKE